MWHQPKRLATPFFCLLSTTDHDFVLSEYTKNHRRFVTHILIFYLFIMSLLCVYYWSLYLLLLHEYVFCLLGQFICSHGSFITLSAAPHPYFPTYSSLCLCLHLRYHCIYTPISIIIFISNSSSADHCMDFFNSRSSRTSPI